MNESSAEKHLAIFENSDISQKLCFGISYSPWAINRILKSFTRSSMRDLIYRISSLPFWMSISEPCHSCFMIHDF